MPQLETVNFSCMLFWIHYTWIVSYGFALVYLFYPLTAASKIRYKFWWKVLVTLHLFYNK